MRAPTRLGAGDPARTSDSARPTESSLPPPVICKQQAPELEPAATVPPPLAPAGPLPPPPPPSQGAPTVDELIQQSQWNLQQQEQHLLALRQVPGSGDGP